MYYIYTFLLLLKKHPVELLSHINRADYLHAKDGNVAANVVTPSPIFVYMQIPSARLVRLMLDLMLLTRVVFIFIPNCENTSIVYMRHKHILYMRSARNCANHFQTTYFAFLSTNRVCYMCGNLLVFTYRRWFFENTMNKRVINHERRIYTYIYMVCVSRLSAIRMHNWSTVR